ncbi:hypothetical protein OE88DRAFT_1660773 [Heliocybe sulcata]|uniref:DUF6533 domain-containing protein n=1 Tax=Heliocybe sulcata TaxID=5364 RepID=A0A5C3MZE2_9AGAM|nr:hypothetical protein OE88DRAFT_1660773 [Heliocybe sulcata]
MATANSTGAAMATLTVILYPSALPNPQTPLAFLPPSLAAQFEASRYLYIASLSGYIWDILLALPQEYALLTRSKIRPPTAVYFFSRIAALSYIITSTVFQVAPVGSCQALQVALGVCFAVSVPATSLLFFFRIRAVFRRRPFVVAIFAFLWIATLAGSITVPFAITGGHIGPTNRCINTGVKSFSSVGIIINGVNDSLVFLAISWHLLTSHLVETKWSDRARSFFRGTGFNGLSRSLLQGGQAYYLATVGLNILTIIMILTPSVPAVFHAMFTVPNVALENAMACRVFRELKLGLLRGPEDSLDHSQGGVMIAMSRRPHTAASGQVESDYVNTSQPGAGLSIKIDREVTQRAESGLSSKAVPFDDRDSYME